MAFTKEQNDAINARGRSVIVSAGAGSGKTSVLIERLIKILSDEENKIPAEKVIVVTFTKDAASQIRQRLSAAIEKKLSEEPDNLWLISQQSDLCFAKISTIHSFCFDMIRDNAELAGVLSDFRVADENEEKIIISDAVKTVMAENSLRFPDVMRELRGFFCSKKDYELCQTLEKLYGYAVAMPFYEDVLSDILGGFSEGVDKRIINEYTELLSEQAGDFSETALYCSGLAEKVGAESIRQVFENEYDMFSSVSEKITDNTIPFDDRIEFFASVVFKTMPKFKPEDEYSESVKEEFSSLRDGYKDKYRKICKEHLFRYSDMEDDRIIHERILSYLIRIVSEIDEKIHSVKETKNVLTFSDAERVSVRLLCRKDDNGNIVRTELAEQLSDYYGEIMIDEYQDSNAMQDLIFRMLSKNSENLFTVGDIKQSIYRFRQSDPTIFADALKSAREYDDAGETEPAVIRLNKNFRSSNDVVDFVNFMFSLVMSEKTGEIDYSDNQALEASAEYPPYERKTEIIIINEETEEDYEEVSSEEDDGENQAVEKIDVRAVKSEAFAVAMKIKEMLLSEEKNVRVDGKTMRRCQPKDFCILTRTRNAGLVFAEELEKNGIRVANEDVSGYLKSDEMSVLINLLKIIDNPLLDIPMASVMMSAMFMITPDEMAKIRMCKKKAPLYSAVCEALRNENEDYYTKLNNFKESLDKLRISATGYSLEKLIRTIYDSTDYLTVMHLYGDGEKKKANLRLILEYAKGYEQNYNGGLSGFIRYINAVFENGGDFKKVSMASESDNVVNIKTIHKSKGLEYPFVFLCSVSSEFNRSDINSQIQTDGKNGTGFKIRNSENLKYYDSVYHYVYGMRNLGYMISEEMRLLYVAMTRAKDRLFITLKNDKKLISSARKAAVSINANNGITPSLTSKAGCMADWIVSVLVIHPGGQVIRDLCGYDGYIAKGDVPSVEFSVVENDTVSEKKEQRAVADEEKLKKLKEIIDYDYDFSLSETAAKLTVTEIAAESREMTLKRPKFIVSEGKLSGAEKGTATHLFMQYCDMSLAEKDVSSERDRLYENGLLGNKESRAIEIPLIEKFFCSGLYSRMKSAGKLERERKFLLRISDIDVPDELKNDYKNTDGMIQGVIDCLFEEDDGIVLVDYKTDSSKDEAALRAEYAPQLILYKAALEVVYGKTVKEAVVYSFRLGREIIISA